MNPLDGFDFGALDSPTFGEDAVREEIIAPVLHALGYTPSGPARVHRSKSLKVPFVMLGSKKYSIRIVPDYTLLVDDKPVLVLDAKNPSEDPKKTEHLWQAYSYAVHPEIRCDRYGICNGRRIVVLSMSSWTCETDIDLTKLDDDSWEELDSQLGPHALRPHVEDKHTAWFYLLGAMLSPNTPVQTAANAVYRLSWYMPAVDASREAAAKAAMAHLSDDELLTVLKAGAYLHGQLDGSPAEHVGYMLSYDKNIVTRLKSTLDRKTIPEALQFIAGEMAHFIDQGES